MLQGSTGGSKAGLAQSEAGLTQPLGEGGSGPAGSHQPWVSPSTSPWGLSSTSSAVSTVTAVSHHMDQGHSGVTAIGRVAAVLFVTLKLPYKNQP